MAKIKNAEAWGREAARERYSLKQSKLPDAELADNLEAPQFAEDARDVTYSNRTSGWVRGAEGDPKMKNETAENKPGYVPGHRGK